MGLSFLYLFALDEASFLKCRKLYLYGKKDFNINLCLTSLEPGEQVELKEVQIVAFSCVLPLSALLPEILTS